jgi:predicted ATPase
VITGVEISGFRGVREGGVDGLSPLSILVGPNNSGKSTCLEAIAAAGMGHDPHEIGWLLRRRGGPPLHALEHVVTYGAESAKIEVQGRGMSWSIEISVRENRDVQRVHEEAHEASKNPVLNMAVQWRNSAKDNILGKTDVSADGLQSTSTTGTVPRRAFPVKFADIRAMWGPGGIEDAYSRIEQAGRVESVVRALQRSMPGLTDLRILKSRSDFILHAMYAKERPVPAYAAGDGFKRFLFLAAAAMHAEEGLALVEEPESFQHPRYLEELATLLLLAAKDGTQIILSTHSIELIDLLLHAPEAEGLTYPTVHRMRLHEGKLRAVAIDHEHALTGRDELLQDLRA